MNQEDGTCRSTIAFSLPNGPETVRDVQVTYTVNGETLTMKWTGAGTTKGRWEGDMFTMNNEGIVFLYRK